MGDQYDKFSLKKLNLKFTSSIQFEILEMYVKNKVKSKVKREIHTLSALK